MSKESKTEELECPFCINEKCGNEHCPYGSGKTSHSEALKPIKVLRLRRFYSFEGSDLAIKPLNCVHLSSEYAKMKLSIVFKRGKLKGCEVERPKYYKLRYKYIKHLEEVYLF